MNSYHTQSIDKKKERIGYLSKSSLDRLKARRKLWLQVHLWLGLALGLLLSIYGITGSILVFHAEINEWLHADMRMVTPPDNATYRSLPEIFAAGRKAMPASAQLTFATYPRNDQAAFTQRYMLTTSTGITETWQVYVNPYTAHVTGKLLLKRSDHWLPETFIGFVFVLHYDLLLPGKISPAIVGSSAALLFISVLTGLIVWWPLTGKWWSALTIKRKASATRFNYDLHKTSGFYTLLVMLPVLFSGIYLVLPHNVASVLELFSPVTYRYWFTSTPQPKQPPISMADAVALAKRMYPKGHPHWIYGAPEPNDTYTVCLDDVDRPGSLLQRVCVVIDRYSGDYLDIDDPALPSVSAGEIFTHWQWPLHSGQAFDMTGRILVFLTGLACPILFITGVIRWLQKRKAAKVKARKC